MRFRPAPLLLALIAMTISPPAHAADAHNASADADLVERMAAEHQHDHAAPSPAAQTAPAIAVEESRPVYATVDGKPVTGFLARPKGGGANLPGILVIHEWWGLNANIEAMARQLAGEGYAALAVDLYEGVRAEKPEDARGAMQAAMGRAPMLVENLRQAAQFLSQAGSQKIGVVGWCFGGGWSLQTALQVPEKINAAVIYYGRVVTDATSLAPLKSPVLGLFGALDKGIPVESVRQFETAAKAAGKPVEVHIYADADHAFANPSGNRYQATAAEDAWKKTLAFFGQHLKS